MKKLSILITFILLSCSGSDENPTTDTSTIVGKWQLVSTSTGTLSSCNLENATFRFNSNNTLIETDGHLSGNICVVGTYNGNYTLINNVLTVREVNNSGAVIHTYTYNLINVTGSELSLKYPQNNNIILNYERIE